jgi:hypothetical protein
MRRKDIGYVGRPIIFCLETLRGKYHFGYLGVDRIMKSYLRGSNVSTVKRV